MVCESLCGSGPDYHCHSARPIATRRPDRSGQAGPALGARPSSGTRAGHRSKPGTGASAGGSGASPIGPHGTLRQPTVPSRAVFIRRLFARSPWRLPMRFAISSGGSIGTIKPQQVSARTGTWVYPRAIWLRSTCGATASTRRSGRLAADCEPSSLRRPSLRWSVSAPPLPCST